MINEVTTISPTLPFSMMCALVENVVMQTCLHFSILHVFVDVMRHQMHIVRVVTLYIFRPCQYGNGFLPITLALLRER